MYLSISSVSLDLRNPVGTLPEYSRITYYQTVCIPLAYPERHYLDISYCLNIATLLRPQAYPKLSALFPPFRLHAFAVLNSFLQTSIAHFLFNNQTGTKRN